MIEREIKKKRNQFEQELFFPEKQGVSQMEQEAPEQREKRPRDEPEKDQEGANKRTFMDEIREAREAAANKLKTEVQRFEEFLKTKDPIPTVEDVALDWSGRIKQRLLELIGARDTAKSAHVRLSKNLDARLEVGGSGFIYVRSPENFAKWHFQATEFEAISCANVLRLREQLVVKTANHICSLTGVLVTLRVAEFGEPVIDLDWD